MTDSLHSFIVDESFGRYATLIEALVPDAAGLALCDENGQVLQTSEFDTAAGMSQAIAWLDAECPDWPSYPQPQIYTFGEQTLITNGLKNTRHEVVATLVLVLPGKHARPPGNPSLQAIADCMEHELKLDTELASMTAELTERYEELNLVYHTEDQVNYFRQGQEALRTLTQNCLDYLDVGLSVLILKKKGVALSFDHPSNPLPNAVRIRSRLAEDLYEWVRKTGETVVINEPTDSLAPSLTPGIPHRVLCCPIFESSGDVVGVLATVNSFDKPIFTNSDRNLLQIMARKAAKIIVANYDSLTGLINRNGYEYFLALALANVRTTNAKKSLLHINVDQLHIINETLGHAAGDEVLRSVAGIVGSIKREADVFGRVGGDEFGVLLHACSSNDAADFAERICETIEKSRIRFDGEEYKVTVSIGVAMMLPTSKSVAQVIGGAELACSVAKEQGQNRVEVYRLDNVDVLRREEQVHSVGHIQSALDGNNFELYCQPIQSLTADDHSHHTEILLRLIDHSGMVIEPDKFIPAAERYHMMPAVDRWVISKTLSVLSELDRSVLMNGTFAINLSGQSLGENGFFEFVRSEIEHAGVPPTSICFEVTETAAVAKMDKAIHFMHSVREIGCSFSLDDFGSGTSSFGYLKRLPVDFLKIDGAIIRDMVKDETSEAMVFAINQVGHTMKLRTIAEFAESPEIVARLKEIGVDYAQGYEIGRPIPLTDRLQEIQFRPASVAL